MHYTTVAGPVTATRRRRFAGRLQGEVRQDSEPFAAQAYDAITIGLKGLEAAIKDAGGEAPTREAVAAVRKVKHTGITGTVEFDDKGDPKKAIYFVIQVAPKWDDNKTVKRMEIAAPAAKKQ